MPGTATDASAARAWLTRPRLVHAASGSLDWLQNPQFKKHENTLPFRMKSAFLRGPERIAETRVRGMPRFGGQPRPAATCPQPHDVADKLKLSTLNSKQSGRRLARGGAVFPPGISSRPHLFSWLCHTFLRSELPCSPRGRIFLARQVFSEKSCADAKINV